MIFISTQKSKGVFGGQKFVEAHAYPFPILFDEEREVSKAYGVYNMFGIDAFRIAHPAVFYISSQGRILWVGVSPSQSETASTSKVLQAIEAVGKY